MRPFRFRLPFAVFLHLLSTGCIDWEAARAIARGDPAPELDAGVDGGAEVLPDGGGLPDGGELPDGGQTAPGRICNPWGWCFSHPAPVRDAFYGLGDLGGEILAVGNNGVLATWTDSGWLGTMDRPMEALLGVWVRGADDAWAVGMGGRILHYGGTVWSQVTSGVTGTLRAVWGPPGSDRLWAVGDDGRIITWDGTGWSAETSPTSHRLDAVYGTSPSDVWAVGDLGVILHRDATTWGLVTSGTTQALHAVVASGSRAWAAGDNGTVLEFKAGLWSVVPPASTEALFALAIKDGVVWTAGSGGSVRRLDGTGVPSTGVTEVLYAVLPVSATEVWAVGEHGVTLRFDGSSWERMDVDQKPTGWRLTGLWASGPDDVWAVGASGTFLHWNGERWLKAATTITEQQRAISGVSATQIWSLGDDTFYFDGTSWSAAPGSGLGNAIYAAPNDEVWVVGDGGKVMRRTADGKWSGLASGVTANLTDVFGTSGNDVWIVGTAGTILHWNGTALSPMPIPSVTRDFSAGWSVSETDVWVVGPREYYDTDDTVYHWDGDTWSARPTGQAVSFRDIGGSGPDDIYAVGQWRALAFHGALFHWDGALWLPVYDGTLGSLKSVYAAPGGSVWVAGENDFILEHPQ